MDLCMKWKRIKKLSISHGVLALLYDLFNSKSTEYTAKRIINTKILAYVSSEDIQDQIDIIKS